ncbi:MAG: hypothetical protein WBL06_02120 [Pseudolysinimonas sp.]|uniref:hypothetical protein n=1 Tax=Pseudolysinimonas sp. TaxID=2680009 RepID=UPI003C739CCA
MTSRLLAAAMLATAVSAVAPVAPVQAISGSDFIPGAIISDTLFYDADAMSESEIQQFLTAKGSGLAHMTFTVASRPRSISQDTGNVKCEAFQGGEWLPAATIIFRAQSSCGISAKVILVTLQKEQGLITKSAPSQSALDRAMGYACPDTAPCAPSTLGFGNQVYSGALQLNTYKASRFGRQPGSHAIQWHPNAACGSTTVYIQNYATAALYNYTPYQPNAAALANLGGTGDSCSSYGNRNFWRFYNAWFGDTLALSEPHPVTGPSIAGSSAVGSTMTAQTGPWTGSPSFGFVWMSCTSRPLVIFDGVPSGCTAISGATSQTYTTVAVDAGRFIAILVTGTNQYGSMTAGGVFPVAVGHPVNLTPPTVSGVATVGSTWTVDVGTWAGTPTPTMAIHWLRCTQPMNVIYTVVPSGCVVISGATATTYVSTQTDVGRYLTAQVAGNSPLGFALAGAVSTIPVGFPTNTVLPTVSGAAPIGSTWTVDVGTWTGSPAPTMAIHWLRCDQPVSATYTFVPSGCVVISGATATTYVSKAADGGKYLTAQVAGNSPLGFSLAGAVNTVATHSAFPANTVLPTVSGAAPIGSTWTVDVGTWTGSPAPTMAIHWLRCNQPVSATYTFVPSGCVVISGATATTYVSKAADGGKYLTAQVAGNSPLGFSIAGAINTLATTP